MKTSDTHSEGDADSGRLVVMSSRVRLARNLSGTPFPGWAKKADRQKSLESMKAVVRILPEMAGALARSMDEFTALEKQLLVERHLISREHAAKTVGSGVVISESEVISVMINEEDHLRMQALMPGFCLREVWQVINRVDSELEEHLNYAYSSKLGYLTACPTNVGTGMRASAMLHLPALVVAEQINQVIQAVNKLGLAVRGLYGEGTEASGNLFQVSNQTTLGEREEDLMERLTKVILQIIEHEKNARQALMEKRPQMIYDQVGRAYGILGNACVQSSKEAMNLLSMLRLGLDLDLLQGLDHKSIDDMFLLTQPAHLQKHVNQKLTAEQRDVMRASLLRDMLKDVGRPKTMLPSPPESTEPGREDQPDAA
ncbi:MAG: protein arginine kinase [Verrucomicrobia bacterium]|nr:protein arginine kinase [Verrucomicrobiota bacterium]